MLATVYYCQGTPLIMSKCLIQQQQKSRAHYTLKIIKGFEILSVIFKTELVIYFKFSIESAPFIVVTKFVITLQNSKLDCTSRQNSYHHPFLAIFTSFQPPPPLFVNDFLVLFLKVPNAHRNPFTLPNQVKTKANKNFPLFSIYFKTCLRGFVLD